MSYILDALKRADAERERGAVPGLHAQPAAMALPEEPASGPLPPWAWGVGGLVTALLGVLAWSVWHGDEAPAASNRPAMVAQGPGEPAPRAGPTVQAEALPGGDTDDQRPMPRDLPRAAEDSPPAATAQRPDEKAASDRKTPQRAAMGPAAGTPVRPTPHPPQGHDTAAASAAPTMASAAATAEARTTSSRVHTLSELPDHVRRSLPPLVIGGAMYSDNPGSRMLVINSQLFHEGDKLGQDLTLEEIKLKSAVLRYKDWRYSVTY